MVPEAIIRARALGKCHHIFNRPQDRLWQTLWRGRRTFHRDFWALRDVTLDIRPGDSVGIIGRNGSGKSTLLQLIAGTLNPTCGELSVSGRISALLELGSGFNPDFTGRENVYLNAAVIGVPDRELEARLDEILAFADIGEFIDQPIKTYSSGMIMRLAFSVAACIEPEILIVDEALAVGDAGFQFKCLDRLRKLTDSGTTLLFVSHELAMVKTFCNRAVYLERGRVKYEGTPDEAGECYLQDIRAEQRRSFDGGAGLIVRKPALAGEDKVAFGTGHGRIADVSFVDRPGRQEFFDFGAEVAVRICVEYGPEVNYPCVALALMDRRHVVVAGCYSKPLPAVGAGQGQATVCLTFSFRARLGEGHYFVTAVLEDRATDTHSLLVEKQAAVLSFQVMPAAGSRMLGMFDLGIEVSVEAETSRHEIME